MRPFHKTDLLGCQSKKCRGSRFTYYRTYIAPNYKTIFFATHEHKLEPTPLFANRTTISMRLIPHALWWETRHWSTCDESSRLCALCPKQVQELSHFDKCSTFNNLQLYFAYLPPNPILARLLITLPTKAP